MPIIKRYDGPTRFLHEASKADVPPYLVELETSGLTGHCTCPHFQMRLWPAILKGERGPALRCKHIDTCRHLYALELKIDNGEALDQVLRQYVKTQGADPKGAQWPPAEPID